MATRGKNTGLIYIYTGDGKGKTSAALGQVLRGLANGWKVGWISWYKEASWGISEHSFSALLLPDARKRLQFFAMGKGFFLKEKQRNGKLKTARVNAGVVIDDDSPKEHKIAAQLALKKAGELINEVDLLILDEVCNAIDDKLLTNAEVLKILDKRGQTHLILTGRHVSPALQHAADLVSEIQKRKHPYDSGKLAVKGLDF
jgi:cob(I)alamin adenosyltransferase